MSTHRSVCDVAYVCVSLTLPSLNSYMLAVVLSLKSKLKRLRRRKPNSKRFRKWRNIAFWTRSRTPPNQQMGLKAEKTKRENQTCQSRSKVAREGKAPLGMRWRMTTCWTQRKYVIFRLAIQCESLPSFCSHIDECLVFTPKNWDEESSEEEDLQTEITEENAGEVIHQEAPRKKQRAR